MKALLKAVCAAIAAFAILECVRAEEPSPSPPQETNSGLVTPAPENSPAPEIPSVPAAAPANVPDSMPFQAPSSGGLESVRIGKRVYVRDTTSKVWTALPDAQGPLGASAFTTGAAPVLRAPNRVFGADRLPPVDDPNSIGYSPTSALTSLSVGSVPQIEALGLAPADADFEDSPPVNISYNIELRPGLYYDTGFIPGGFGPFAAQSVALNGSGPAHERGQLTFFNLDNSITTAKPGAASANLPAKFQFDLQSGDVLNFGTGQLYFDFLTPTFDNITTRYAMARVDGGSDTTVVIGQGPTLLGDMGGSPVTINSGSLPVGFVGPYKVVGGAGDIFTGIPQFRIDQLLLDGDVRAGLSIEDQRPLKDVNNGAVKSPVVLNRWPSIVGRLRFEPGNSLTNLQIAGVYRRIGFDSLPTYNDYFTNGYGISVMGRLQDAARDNVLFSGATVGRGLGHYLYGGMSSAVITSNTNIRSVGSVGAYVGIEHTWTRLETYRIVSNAACAFLVSDIAVAAENEEIRQAWCNVLWDGGTRWKAGLEYQYGWRQIVAGTTGDDHRFGFTVQIVLGPTAGQAVAQATVGAQFQAEAAGAPASQEMQVIQRDFRKRL